MKISCLVVDDERLALEVMEAYIERVPYLRLAALCPTPLEALDYLSRNQVDVLFLDVEMPGLNGLQLLKTLKDPPRIILTTAFPQFAVDAFELDVFDYLLKTHSIPQVSSICTETERSSCQPTAGRPSWPSLKSFQGVILFCKIRLEDATARF